MATVETAAPERLMTIAEYAQLPDDGTATELVRGRVITVSLPIPWHGFVCGKVGRIIGGFAELHDLGYPITNDAINSRGSGSPVSRDHPSGGFGHVRVRRFAQDQGVRGTL
jgi:Uma2 family endonuclease